MQKVPVEFQIYIVLGCTFLHFTFICAFSQSSVQNVTISYDPLRKNWAYMPFDSPDFACSQYGPLCNDFLDKIGCVSSSRTNIGCDPDLYRFNGTCLCDGNPVYQDRGARIAEILVDNRIKGEIGWMLEPWDGSPPYSLEASFSPICKLLLHRLGCPETQQASAVGSRDGETPFACTCGAFQSGSSRIQELICDKITEGYVGGLQVFEDPYTFSVELSLAVLLVGGKVGAIMAAAGHLPPAVGSLLAGFALQDLISPALVREAAGGPRSTPLGEFRALALLVLLLRAGLAVGSRRPRSLSRVWRATLALLPFVGEFAAALLTSTLLLGWGLADASILAAVLSAPCPSPASPAKVDRVLIPATADAGSEPNSAAASKSDAVGSGSERENGDAAIAMREIGDVAIAPVEFLLAATLFSAAAAPGQAAPSPIYPWVRPLPPWLVILLIPANLAFSAVVGGFLGAVAALTARCARSAPPTLAARLVPHGAGAEAAFAAFAAAAAAFALCGPQYVQQASPAVAAAAVATVAARLGPVGLAEDLDASLAALWVPLEVFFPSCSLSCEPPRAHMRAHARAHTRMHRSQSSGV